MTVVSALRCDALHVPPPPPASPFAVAVSSYVLDRIDCPAVSRAARNPTVLGVVAERDGWVTTTDGRHLCPEHAAAEKETAA